MSRAESGNKVHDSVGYQVRNTTRAESGGKVQDLVGYYQNMSRAESEVKVHDSVGCQAQNMTKEDSGDWIEHIESKLEEVMMTSDLKLDELRKMPLPAVKVNQLTTPHLNNPQTDGTRASTVSDNTANDDPRKRTHLDEMEDRERDENVTLFLWTFGINKRKSQR